MSSAKQDRIIRLNDIEFDENKLKNLFAARKKKRRYYDYYSDNHDNDSADDECEDSGVEESNEDEEVIIKKKTNIKKKNATKTKLPPIKLKRKQQKGMIDYLNS